MNLFRSHVGFKMNKLILCSFLFLIGGCSVTQARNKIVHKNPILQKRENQELQVSYSFNGTVFHKSSTLEYFVAELTKQARLANCRLTFTSRETAKPSRVILFEEHSDSSFSSWKPYISALSLGLIPIKYLSKYTVSLIDTGVTTRLEEQKLVSWNHLLFLSMIFSKSKMDYEREFLSDFAKTYVTKNCYE